ncbi:NUDIX domain-containing protein [Thalassotalea sp. 1_MG-2023]|uniref:NUDIX domain-containing protein n=1 Tax=Thalassotalea sp. 1_MG-2023 TaxID=3062680 RepID=UPI0026E1256A|nr:NUDIX domain-containing protein [Thalassotalea sp. 1_MG-2023]MDO6428060.1 NUDIX domain-containing protein [Thalassotalea sp. 1_MG-2023]
MKHKHTVSAILGYTQSDYTLHSKETLYQGFFKIDGYQVSHKKYDGSVSEVISREIFERDDAVVVIPYDPALDQVILIEQFRAGAIRYGGNPWLLEFVAGMFEEHESPMDVAIREAKEEANIDIAPENMQKVMTYLSSPGGMSEAMHVYLAKVNSENIGGVFGLDEEHEDILVHVIKREQAMALLSEGKITNAATIIGLQWLALNYQTL